MEKVEKVGAEAKFHPHEENLERKSAARKTLFALNLNLNSSMGLCILFFFVFFNLMSVRKQLNLHM